MAIRWELMLQHGDKGVKKRVGHSAIDFRKGAPHCSHTGLGSGAANLERWGGVGWEAKRCAELEKH